MPEKSFLQEIETMTSLDDVRQAISEDNDPSNYAYSYLKAHFLLDSKDPDLSLKNGDATIPLSVLGIGKDWSV